MQLDPNDQKEGDEPIAYTALRRMRCLDLRALVGMRREEIEKALGRPVVRDGFLEPTVLGYSLPGYAGPRDDGSIFLEIDGGITLAIELDGDVSRSAWWSTGW